MKKLSLLILLSLLVTLSACDFNGKEVRTMVMSDSQDTVEINTNWEEGNAWLEYGDMKVEADSTGVVDTTTLGLYEITYTVVNDGTTYTDIRYVIVIDTIAPILEIELGIDTITINSTWNDSGAMVCDNSLEALSYTTTGIVDTTTLGAYTITYTATDSSGNLGSVDRIVTVVE